MSKDKEKKLWALTKKGLTLPGRRVGIRVENWAERGTPDSVWLLHGRTVWIENKVVPSVGGWQFSHPLTPEQVAWHYRWCKHGGLSWILARRSYLLRLYFGLHSREIQDLGWEGPYECEFAAPVDWDMFQLIARSIPK